MRKLNAKGVVPTKQAFSVNAKKGSQMSEVKSVMLFVDCAALFYFCVVAVQHVARLAVLF